MKKFQVGGRNLSIAESEICSQLLKAKKQNKALQGLFRQQRQRPQQQQLLQCNDLLHNNDSDNSDFETLLTICLMQLTFLCSSPLKDVFECRDQS